MLSIRLQRTGRKGHAQYRVVVQDSRQTPTSGKYVAHLGHYDPHAKTAVVDKEKAEFYLSHGAQPSDRIARLFAAEKIDLPKWVTAASDRKRELRNPEKLRRNQPKEEVVVEAPKEEVAETEAEAPAEESKEA